MIEFKRPLFWMMLVLGLISSWASGQLGWERGDALAQYEAHVDHEQNIKTMEQIGVCQWAEIVANCKWKSP